MPTAWEEKGPVPFSSHFFCKIVVRLFPRIKVPVDSERYIYSGNLSMINLVKARRGGVFA